MALSLFCGIALAQPQPQSQSHAASGLRVNNRKTEVSVTFASLGGTQTLTVDADGGDYDISGLPFWCLVDKSAGSFTLSCISNGLSSKRSGWFTVTSGDKVVKVKVVQLGSKVPSPSRVSGSRYDKPEPKRESTPKAADVSSANEHKIDVSTSFSSYFSSDGTAYFDSTAPATFTPAYMHSLSLSMGMNLYKGMSAYFDFGINNKTVKKTLDWAGRIGSKYFDLQIEYNFIGGEVSYWEDANIGVKKNSPPDLKTDYDQTWITVALMYPLPIGFDRTDGSRTSPMLLGLFYNHANVPALVWVNKKSKDKKSRYAFLDKSCPVSIYGIRYYWDNIGLKRIPDNLPNGWTWTIPWRVIGDMGFGFASPNKDVVAMATENGGQFTDYSFATYYLDVRTSLILEWFNRFTENQVVHFGVGVEVHGLGYIRNEEQEWALLDNWSSIKVGGWGPTIRVGYAW